ncbi:MAG: hypothetical protein PHH14_03895 [Candidatus Margulisbacteria bacterium]|nr:hypothetical protein [Candidatus Margulisiibacteriota bacterium]
MLSKIKFISAKAEAIYYDAIARASSEKAKSNIDLLFRISANSNGDKILDEAEAIRARNTLMLYDRSLLSLIGINHVIYTEEETKKALDHILIHNPPRFQWRVANKLVFWPEGSEGLTLRDIRFYEVASTTVNGLSFKVTASEFDSDVFYHDWLISEISPFLHNSLGDRYIEALKELDMVYLKNMLCSKKFGKTLIINSQTDYYSRSPEYDLTSVKLMTLHEIAHYIFEESAVFSVQEKNRINEIFGSIKFSPELYELTSEYYYARDYIRPYGHFGHSADSASELFASIFTITNMFDEKFLKNMQELRAKGQDKTVNLLLELRSLILSKKTSTP